MSSAIKSTQGLARAAATRAGSLVGVTPRARRGESRPGDGYVSARQAITIGRTQEELTAFFRDPAALSQILGRFGRVEETAKGDYVWHLRVPGEDDLQVQADLDTEVAAMLWAETGVDEKARPQRVLIEFTQAPKDFGVEVHLGVSIRPPASLPTPLERLALGGALTKVLYRAKALIETGEIPTLAHNPAARNGGSDHDED